MDLKLIQRLIALMNRGGLAEIDLEDSQSGIKLRLKRESAAPPPQAPMVHFLQGASSGGSVPQMHQGNMAPSAAAPEAPQKKEAIGTPIQSPMVGTFYRAGSPEAEAFVSVGKRITPDTVLCIIEAMKVMNEIKSEVSGEILEVLVENGEPVEFGQPLFLVKTS